MTRPAGAAAGRPGRVRGWIGGFAGTRRAEWALFGIAFVESSLLPVPPDALLLPMGIARPERSYRYALVCAAGSAAGAFLGYLIGFAFFEAVGRPLLQWYGVLDRFEGVLRTYADNGFATLLLAGFTPLPFQLFTVAAGFNQTVPIGTLAAGAIAGRLVRFGLVGALLHRFGARVGDFLDRRFGKLSVAFVGAAVLAVAIFKLFF